MLCKKKISFVFRDNLISLKNEMNVCLQNVAFNFT